MLTIKSNYPATLAFALALAGAVACSQDAPGASGAAARPDALPITAETVTTSKVDEASEYVGLLTSRRSVT